MAFPTAASARPIDGAPVDGNPPFGSFDTPLDGSKVRSSIPVTGWVLDDVEVENVKIYNGDAYVGDAVFVEGARPDIEQQYPDYPNNNRAGWGFMMLSNFLPNRGNGVYLISAKARDNDGNETTLGTKTIRCDNANAVKPFGAIDAPAPRETVSGYDYESWAWALTPPSSSIATDGSTINVYVDGFPIGHPDYNYTRPVGPGAPAGSFSPDLFYPAEYENAQGPYGSIGFDTSAYEDGVHTIQWSATDKDENTGAMGAQYFTIGNSGPRGAREEKRGPGGTRAFDEIPADYSTPVQYLKGYEPDTPLVTVNPGSGKLFISIRETERLEVRLNETGFQGWSHVNDQAEALPIGSTLEAETGVFHWIPGPGFLGLYELVFVRDAGGGAQTKKVVRVLIQAMQETPSPRITANGDSNMTTAANDEPVSIAVALDPGDFQDLEVDYWLVADMGTGLMAYSLTSGGWSAALAPLGRAGLASLPSPAALASLPSLESDATFYFVLSTPSMDRFWYSTVQVTVE